MQSDGRVNAIQDTEELRYWATGTRSLEQGRLNDCAVVRQQIASGTGVVIYGIVIKRVTWNCSAPTGGCFFGGFSAVG